MTITKMKVSVLISLNLWPKMIIIFGSGWKHLVLPKNNLKNANKKWKIMKLKMISLQLSKKKAINF